MYNQRKAILRRQGLSEKQIAILSDLNNKMIALIKQRRLVEKKYSRLLDKYQKLILQFGIK